MFPSIELMVKCVVGMNGWCDGQVTVVIHSLSCHATMCALWCVCNEESDGTEIANGVWLIVERDEWLFP